MDCCGNNRKSETIEKVKTKEVVITKDMTIGEVVARYPETAEIMLGYGLHCIGCHVNPYESIEAGALGHGMDKETITQMIKEMNEAISNHEEKDIILSDAAVRKFKQLMEAEGKSNYGLKFTIEPGGCAGFSYVMDFAEKPSDNEIVIEEKGLKIFVEKSAFEMVKGCRIDYVDSLHGSGFKISNPNAKNTCGCGKSFH
ncbi:MAG: iron-sulfur cluster assembly accessory protein [Candidatus Diapherotrites archaeon]